MIRVENLVKDYGKLRAVNRLSFQIEKGEIFGFVGANGAGKSTTLKVAAGLLAPTAGTIYINGYDIVKEANQAKASIGYMPDFFGVYDDLTVMEYMNFYAGIHGIMPEERLKVIEPLIELMNLTEKKEAYVDDLSRGMKQRLCLARALVHNPEILLLDEPASGLDPRARIEFREVLLTLKKLGKTILISSHVLLELAEMCTTIGIIEQGKLVAQGSIDTIRQQLAQSSQLKIKATSDLEQVVMVLKETPLVTSIVLDQEQVTCTFGGTKQEKVTLLKTLIEKEVAVWHFEEEDGNLESIFMQLTQEKEGEHA